MKFILLLLLSSSVLGDTCLAQNIYFESRGEPISGQLAVGFVTLNRVKSSRYPNDICSVVKQAKRDRTGLVRHKCQFSWYCDGKPDIITDRVGYLIALEIAKYLVRETQEEDITKGSLFYHSHQVNPYWAPYQNKTVVIGNHIFYR